MMTEEPEEFEEDETCEICGAVIIPGCICDVCGGENEFGDEG